MAQVITRETILQELEGLAADRIPEVLDFIRFLKSGERKLFPTTVPSHPAMTGEAFQVLAELDRIREELETRYGIYPGDPVREVREDRERQMEAVWRPL